MFGDVEQKIVARDKMLSGIAEMLELGIPADDILALAKTATGGKETDAHNKKEQILEALAKMEWSDELEDKLEYEISSFVVYQQDPDDHHTYCYKYHMTEEAAREDFNSRTYVPSGRWCYCVISSLRSDKVYERRQVSL